MKTIEIASGDSKALFTTRSATIGNKEYMYVDMSNVIHKPLDNIYSFVYDGETIVFPYEDKDSKVLNIIFSRIQKMEAENAAFMQSHINQATEESNQPSESSGASSDDNPNINTDSAFNQDAFSSNSDTHTENTAKDSDLPTESNTDSNFNSATDDNAAKPEQSSVSGETLTKSLSNINNDKDNEKTKDPIKTEKLKKSIAIFCGVLAIIAVVSFVYYMVFGTSFDPSIGPNSDESQKYDTIDEVIDDLQ